MLSNSEIEYWYNELYKPLCYCAAKYVGQEDAPDIVCSVFVDLCQKDFSTENIRALLYCCVKNACKSFLKNKASEKNKSIIFNYRLDETDKIYMEDAEILNELWKRICLLTPLEQDIFLLAHLSHKNNHEISLLLSLTEKQVRNKLEYATRRIKAHMYDQFHIPTIKITRRQSALFNSIRQNIAAGYNYEAISLKLGKDKKFVSTTLSLRKKAKRELNHK